MPTISVHIITHNSVSTIQACLDALLNQTGVDFQTLVLDNASVDDTCRLVEDAGISLVQSNENLGYALAHNRLIDQTDSAYVLTLNPDVRLMPGFLEAMRKVLDENMKLGSAAGQLLRVDQLDDSPEVIDSAGVHMRRNRRQGLLGENISIVDYPEQSKPIFGPDGAAAFYRRAMLDDVRVMGEVFDADFFMHKEDIDLCWRAQLRGWSSVYVPAAVAKHIRSFRPGRRERVSAYMRFLGVRNRYLLMLKNEIPAHFWHDFPFIAAYDAGIVAYMLLFERESLSAFRSLLALRPRMLEKRRQIQAGRRVEWHDIAGWFVG
ncbi:MAG: glycosyltransferase family 2 protein [Anaerolineae bacterium]|nr:glycosyltransferase family 2 protein [Anaerolineae bacterium]